MGPSHVSEARRLVMAGVRPASHCIPLPQRAATSAVGSAAARSFSDALTSSSTTSLDSSSTKTRSRLSALGRSSTVLYDTAVFYVTVVSSKQLERETYG